MMCRLFGLAAGHERVSASFWLLDSADSLAAQSHRNPDGTGIGTFTPEGTPRLDKQPIRAWDDREFVKDSTELTSSTFVAHIRYATGTARTAENTHPFEMDGRLFAHNGVIGDLETLEARIGDEGMALVKGETDSERLAALITMEARQGKDFGQAITEALRWVAESLPVYALNLVITTPTELWAVRYPETHELWVLERTGSDENIAPQTSEGLAVRSSDLAGTDSVVVASERLDADPAWRLLPTGTLLHCRPDLTVTETHAFTEPVHTLMVIDDEPNPHTV